MVAFVKRRLQIFVSSTFKDLIEERQSAVEAILTSGHIPAGMELFTAGNESQMDVIKQWIDESDVYLLILGGRYGSIEPITGKSYTHLEYEYAVSKGKQFFACVVTEEAQAQRVKNKGMLVVEQEEPKKLKEFRDLVTSKVVRFWSDIKDIKIITIEKMSHFERDESLLGWVRPENQPNIANLINEITRLSKENSDLRVSLANSKNIFESSEDSDFEYILNKLSELQRAVVVGKTKTNWIQRKEDKENTSIEENFTINVDLDMRALYIKIIMNSKYKLPMYEIRSDIAEDAMKATNLFNRDIETNINFDFDFELKFLHLGLLVQSKKTALPNRANISLMAGSDYELIFSEKFNRFNYWLIQKLKDSDYNFPIIKNAKVV